MKLLFAVLSLAAGVAAADFKPLYNGTNLDGWQMVGPGRFVIEDGLMKTEGGMGLLYYSKQKLADCILRVVFKTTGSRDNSGVVIRLPEPPARPLVWRPQRLRGPDRRRRGRVALDGRHLFPFQGEQPAAEEWRVEHHGH